PPGSCAVSPFGEKRPDGASGGVVADPATPQPARHHRRASRGGRAVVRRRQRLRAGRRGALPGLHVLGALPRVLLRGERFNVRAELGGLTPPARLGALLEDLL